MSDDKWVYKKFLTLAKTKIDEAKIESIVFSLWHKDHIQVVWQKNERRFCSQIKIPKDYYDSIKTIKTN